MVLLPLRIAAQCSQHPDAVAVLHLGPTADPRHTTAISYAQLHQRATTVAAALIRSSISIPYHFPNDTTRTATTRAAVVAVLLDEAPGSIIAELGVSYAGAAFVPLDPGAPVARLRYQLRDCEACALIYSYAQSALVQALLPLDEETRSVQAVELEAILDGTDQYLFGCAQARMNFPPANLRACDACHVIYTSGSAGPPKGVICEHGALAHYADAKLYAHGISSESCVLLASAATWDPSVGDAFSTFACGATLVTAPRARIIQDLRAVLSEGSVTHVCSTPALWRMLPKECSSWEDFPALQVIALGGERLPSSLVQQWRPPPCNGHSGVRAAAFRRRLLNTYGVTEATVYQTVGECHPDDRAGMVGRPLPGVLCAVAAPPGAVGEVYLGGPLLARGYIGADDLTAAKFVTIMDANCTPARNDDSSHADNNDGHEWLLAGRWFRTGDLGRWHGTTTSVVKTTTNGDTVSIGEFVADMEVTGRPELELLGRIDDQIKLRGFRIEPGEVESVLTSHPLVSQAVVVLHADPPKQEQTLQRAESLPLDIETGAEGACQDAASDCVGMPRLVAYVILSDGVPISAWDAGGAETAVRVHCTRQLPVHARPSQFVCLQTFPLTSSGKVDRRILTKEYPPQVSLLPNQLNVAALVDVTGSHSCTPSAMDQAVLAACSHVLGIPEENLSVLDDFFSLGGTSVSAVEMVRRLSESTSPKDSHTDWSDGAFNTIRYCALYRKSRLVDYAAALQWLEGHGLADAELDAEQVLREMDVALPTLNDESSWLNAALKLAARSGNEEVLLTLLDANAHPDGGHTKKNRGDAPLLLAAQGGHQSIVKALVLAGANPNLPDASSRTAVHMSAAGGHAVVLQWLLQTGGGMWTAKDVNKWSPHHFAAWHGHTEVLEVLLRYQGWQLLSLAQEQQARTTGSLTELKLLQDISPCWLQDKHETVNPGTGTTTPMESAAASLRMQELAAAVLRAETLLGPTGRWAAGPIVTGQVYQANRTRRDWSFSLNARDRWQRTPLSWAISHNNVAAVRLLLSVGALLDWKSPYPVRGRGSKSQPWSPSLHLAVAASADPGRSDSDHLVLEQRLGSSGTCGKTWKRRNRVVGEMDHTDQSGDPLTIKGCELKSNDRFAVLRALLQLPQLTAHQLDCVDYEGRTALHEAASLQLTMQHQQHQTTVQSESSKDESTAAVRLLLDAKATATAVDHNGQTALHIALRAGRTEVVALLARYSESVARPVAVALDRNPVNPAIRFTATE